MRRKNHQRLKERRHKQKPQESRRWVLYVKLFLLVLLWGIMAGFIYFVNPNEQGVIILFFVLLFVNVFYTVSLFVKVKRRLVVVTGSLLLFVFLRFVGQGNVLNLLLLGGSVVAFEFYYSK